MGRREPPQRRPRVIVREDLVSAVAVQREPIRADLTHSDAMTITRALDNEQRRVRPRALGSRQRDEGGEESYGTTPAHYRQGSP